MADDSAIQRHAQVIAREFSGKKMVVFLCGPTERDRASKPSAELRFRLRQTLEADGFEVVLGEDDGLETLQRIYGLYAHQNERLFVRDQMAAVVLVADSIGSFCELGMFAECIAQKDGEPSQDFILIANAVFKDDLSYFNFGPAKFVNDFWVTYYVDFVTFDTKVILERLRGRRAIWLSEFRGRPPGGGAK